MAGDELTQHALVAAAPKHGTHTYTFSATNLDEAAVRARTRRYSEFFNVPEEPLSSSTSRTCD